MKINLKKKTQMSYHYSKQGVTQGSLQGFQLCRNKSRLYFQGYQPKFTSPALVYGSIGHSILEGVFNDFRIGEISKPPTRLEISPYVERALKSYRKENPFESSATTQQISYAGGTCEVILPLYFDFWKKDFVDKKFEKVEGSFSIPYELKDGTGRKTVVRGKQDGVFRVPKRPKELWLMEHKFKSFIQEENLVDTLSLDFQVNVYLWALRRLYGIVPTGVLYDIIRKPSIRQNRSETFQVYCKRLEKDVQSRPEFYFIRLEICISEKDMDKFEIEFEYLLRDFVNWFDKSIGHYKNTYHCVDKYGRCPYLPICSKEDYSGFVKKPFVYKELEEGI